MFVSRRVMVSILFLSSMQCAQANDLPEKSNREHASFQALGGGATFSKGDLSQVQSIPSAFGPFSAKTSGIGVYKGRINVSPNDLKEHIFVVVRTQSDSTHRLGWIRTYVNNKLIATEKSIKDNKIIEEVTKDLQGGDAQVIVIGSASQDSCVDCYVVPKDSVIRVVQSRPLSSMISVGGPYVTAGGKQETFNGEFSFHKAETPGGKFILALRTKENKTKRFAWIRAYLNGTAVASEQNLKDAEGSVDITDKLIEGPNKVIVTVAASTGATLDWYVTQVPRFDKTETASATVISSSDKKAPLLTKLSPANEAYAGDLLQIQAANLDPVATNNKVFFGDVSAVGKSLKNNWLSVDLPKDISSGSCGVRVAVAGVKSNAIPLLVKGYPRVRSTSASECPPEYELEILGENFPEQLGQVRVTVGSANARVMQISKQRILIRVPDLPLDTSYPIRVVVGQLSSAEDVSVKISGTAVPATSTGTGQEAKQ